MRIYLLLILSLLMSSPTSAACRCSCDVADLRICASNYSLEHPCEGPCPNQSPATGPMITACPPVQYYNPLTGRYAWTIICPN
jgi:hypothetical protein